MVVHACVKFTFGPIHAAIL
uniref:Uncharacterized protein n=1 Tax=Anguilla anguilla TaxID=7936 RepID=A0A0E9VCH1_ANGAN